jgi:phosphatidate cytidylyltransferase
MLKQRVITALVMLLFFLPALFYPSLEPLSLLTLLLITAAAWEWGRLNGLRQIAALALGGGCALACAGAWWAGLLVRPLFHVWVLGGAVWVLAGAWVLNAGVSAWSIHSRVLRLTAGMLALVVTWLAVAQAKVIGVNYLLSILALVWAADIGAYFSGRALGGRFFKRKLAPSISPGKTWEGVLGGFLGVVLLATSWRWLDATLQLGAPSFFTHMAQKGEGLLLLGLVFLTAMSVVGDLFESLVKRSAGAKDSSGLLPGHGGVLDRVDALLPTLPLAMMLYSI